MSEPWASYEPRAAMGSWETPGMLPGHLAHLRRMEQLERAEQERLEDERADRAQMRLEAWALRRMQEKAWLGESYDPSDYSTLVQSSDELADRFFAAQDAEDERELRRRMIEAGLLAELTISANEITAGSTSAPGAAVSSGESLHSPEGTPQAVKRARELLHRALHRACMCTSCVSVRAARTAR